MRELALNPTGSNEVSTHSELINLRTGYGLQGAMTVAKSVHTAVTVAFLAKDSPENVQLSPRCPDSWTLVEGLDIDVRT